LGYTSSVEKELQIAIKQREVKLVVINTNPEFSKRYSKEFMDWLKQWGLRITLKGPQRYIMYEKNKPQN